MRVCDGRQESRNSPQKQKQAHDDDSIAITSIPALGCRDHQLQKSRARQGVCVCFIIIVMPYLKREHRKEAGKKKKKKRRQLAS